MGVLGQKSGGPRPNLVQDPGGRGLSSRGVFTNRQNFSLSSEMKFVFQ